MVWKLDLVVKALDWDLGDMGLIPGSDTDSFCVLGQVT